MWSASTGSVKWGLVRCRITTPFEAKTHLLQPLDRVAQSETIAITRHGRGRGLLVPAGPRQVNDLLRRSSTGCANCAGCGAQVVRKNRATSCSRRMEYALKKPVSVYDNQ